MERPAAASLKNEKRLLETKLGVLLKQEEEYSALIAHLQRLRAPVVAECKDLEDRIQEIDALQLPINWLPNELLSRIFVLVAQLEAHENARFERTEILVAPVVLSLVCKRWQKAAYSEPEVWTNLHFSSPKDNLRMEPHVSRSGSLPLHIRLWYPQQTASAFLFPKIRAFISTIRPHFSRITQLAVGVGAPEAMVPIISSLRSGNFPVLESLYLRVTKENPSFSPEVRSSLLEVLGATPHAGNLPHLRHLRLHEVPIEALSGEQFLSNLTTLELYFPPRRAIPHRLGGGKYYLKLSALLTMLAATSRLEELTLTDTIPVFDVISPDDARLDAASDLPVTRMLPVKLQHLKSIGWDSPTTGEAHWFMAFLDCPIVEKLDLSLAIASQRKFRDPYYHAFSAASRAGVTAIPFPSLRECVFQCPEDDTSTATLRKFTFPTLEKLELINITPPKPASNGENPTQWPPLPRLESIFRDPRLFHLTHLTLSQYTFAKDHLRAEAVFGYMPVLTSLAVDSCLGVAFLLRVLEEKTSSSVALQQQHGNVRMRRGVKVCPRLESLSIWGCDDLEFRVLLRIVRARRGDKDGSGESGDGIGDQPLLFSATDGGERTATRGTSLPNEVEVGAGKAPQLATPPQTATPIGRKIRPLRKSRQLAAGVSNGAPLGFPDTQNGVPSQNILSTIVAAQESMNPAPIAFIRIHDCALISEAQVSDLQAEGDVESVVWTASHS